MTHPKKLSCDFQVLSLPYTDGSTRQPNRRFGAMYPYKTVYQLHEDFKGRVRRLWSVEPHELQGSPQQHCRGPPNNTETPLWIKYEADKNRHGGTALLHVTYGWKLLRSFRNKGLHARPWEAWGKNAVLKAW